MLADSAVMDTVVPGCHGSTFGGNPMACAISRAALRVVHDEGLVERAAAMGARWEAAVSPLLDGPNRLVVARRGRGLLQALELDVGAMDKAGFDAMEVCYVLKEKGVLAKPTHESTIRFAPPLVITEAQLDQGAAAVVSTIGEFERRCA